MHHVPATAMDDNDGTTALFGLRSFIVNVHIRMYMDSS